ncbi:hypothetical protein E5288_WYG011520 [Bos mutus]|uniref:Uncharacterized protein n=1 Tax=Bos mutus TaxID=72004 RepID=A0A6B0RHY7_9CETA|nr:hypothetical protein [Bos mutus]
MTKDLCHEAFPGADASLALTWVISLVVSLIDISVLEKEFRSQKKLSKAALGGAEKSGGTETEPCFAAFEQPWEAGLEKMLTVPQTDDAITCDRLPTPLFIHVLLTHEESWVVLSSL